MNTQERSGDDGYCASHLLIEWAIIYSQGSGGVLRVLQFGRYNFDEHKGGVQFYADSLTKELRRSIEVDLLVSSLGRKTKIEKSERGWRVSVASFGILQSVPLSPMMLFWALKLCRERKYDIIHLNFPDPLSLLVAYFLPKGTPLVVTWHSDVIRQKKFIPIYMKFLKPIMDRVTRVIVATPYHFRSCPQLILQKDADQKTVVIPFGIDPRQWELSSETQVLSKKIKEKHAGKFLLFTFGRHVPYKGYIYLLEALKGTENVHLILGGEGPLTEEYKEFLSENGLQDKVTFCGLIPQKEVPAYLDACDLFCFPSIDKTEAFGYTQVEAMMRGKPILSAFLDNGVNYVSIHGETGLTVPPRDPEALRNAIKELQRDPQKLKTFGIAAQKRALSEFTESVMAERTLEFYRRLLGSKA